MKSINPVNNTLIKEYEEFTESKLKDLILKTKEQFCSWSSLSFEQRSEYFIKLSEILLKNKERYASVMTQEMGKPLAQGIAEIEKCSLVCDFYSKNAKNFLADKLIKSEYTLSKVIHRPLGVILGIMPWNYPFWQVLRFAAPTMMAGNCVVLKHASNVTGSLLAIEDAFKEAGFPVNTFTPLLVSGSKMNSVISSEHINAVSLTGSTQAGKQVAKLCGEHLKKCLLELGGSDPYIVLEDANLESAAKLCVQSRMQNNGQSCIGAKRFIVHEDIYDKFVHLFKMQMNNYKFGNPKSLDCNLGPMARVDLRDELSDKVNTCEKLGAKVTYLNNEVVEGSAYLSPCIIENITEAMPAYSEEFFGPVASIFKFKDLNEAVNLANATVFGLGCGVFTSDIDLALDIAQNRLDAGAAFINTYVKSNPKLPFGGIKESGFGRELSENGILEFVNVKTICIDNPK